MTPTVQALQRRLIALKFPLPKFGADGDFGAETIFAINAALDKPATLRQMKTMLVPPATTPQAASIATTVHQFPAGGPGDHSPS